MLAQIICFDAEYEPIDARVLKFEHVLKLGSARLSPEDRADFLASLPARTPDDPHTLLYTSGTTGVPKGVMLSNGNLLSNIHGCQAANPVDQQDRFLSFLPLSHIFERAGQYYAISGGGAIYFCDEVTRVVDFLPEVNPTVMFAVPRFFEKIYSAVTTKFENESALKRRIATWAVKIGRQYHAAEFKQRPGLWLKLRHGIADRLVFSKVRGRFGSSLKYFISGGAPLKKEIALFLQAMGVIVLEGYGLTETSPVVSGNLAADPRMGNAGPVLSNVEVDFGPDGEVLVKGPSVFKGYYKDPQATAEAFDDKGWFHTGDLGELRDGCLHITGRKKNIIITSGGKNIMPTPIEDALEIHPMVDQVVAVGNQQKFISALIVPAFEHLQEWAHNQSLKWQDREELVNLKEVQEHFHEMVENAMQGFSGFERVKKFILLHSPFAIEEGTLTPKLSIRRDQVEKRYRELIEKLYKRKS
jgi:long-chain acyl-CoA synthetase